MPCLRAGSIRVDHLPDQTASSARSARVRSSQSITSQTISHHWRQLFYSGQRLSFYSAHIFHSDRLFRPEHGFRTRSSSRPDARHIA